MNGKKARLIRRIVYALGEPGGLEGPGDPRKIRRVHQNFKKTAKTLSISALEKLAAQMEV